MSLLKSFMVVSLMLFLAACSSSSENTENSVVDQSEQGDQTNQPEQTDEEDQTDQMEQTGQREASYRVTFSDNWTAANFPTNFTSGRHFSGLIGATHNEQVIFWEVGQTATAGIQNMAETGAKGNLQNEVNSAIDEGKSDQVLSGGGIGDSPSSVSIDIKITKDYPLVTLVSMVAPSPDWFVGVGGLDLRGADGNFVSTLTVPLAVYDAGTDDGPRFTSSNSASDGEVITRLSCQAIDCDFLEGVHRDPAVSVTTIGSFLFERTQ